MQNQPLLNHEKYLNLRKKHPVFYYKGFKIEKFKNEIEIIYLFNIGKEIHFTPKIVIKMGKYFVETSIKELTPIIFNIGLIELISYWKCTCSPTIYIDSFKLTPEMESWWKKLYWKGLGEFYYQNSIKDSEENFIHFEYSPNADKIETSVIQPIGISNKVIVPIGGGKDSVVTLEQLRQDREVIPFIINPRGATIECARTAGFSENDSIIIMERTIDPTLLKLNKEGYLNGHTPFSAMLAFYSVLISYLSQIKDVALSNESSANEATIPGTDINHQYSKSLEFEHDFNNYVSKFLNNCNHYYSYLRKETELSIAEKFAQYTAYHSIFKSCNVGSKENRWCCECSKCLFTYIILSPFLSKEQLVNIFGENLLEKASLTQYFDELCGIAYKKPFECVGTIEEVNEAIRRIIPQHSDSYLIKHYIEKKKIKF